ncbi:lysosomal acid lipase/cholesteryl ester hydrolase-like isoform X2 [Macrosteles quadrilineatus]|uniref:lysosomal acid lipase/cholesteryl ester hydrolase-like isoform X2 n=1 Tax=Macrosteles quadrilineatus TaxID=74068 RepID=UPI0023E099A6|nr:lysosomal acid lipase/cholesteryl ester hydrolase-like isoform X2 [Macrosteles quadrilineatus]
MKLKLLRHLSSRLFSSKKIEIPLGLPCKVDLIRSQKYSADEYTVRTDDGYLLGLTRIRSTGTKPPVLMVHGVIAASDQWVLRGPDQDLAFILADQGHEVWLSDNRGNFYSRNHEKLTVSDPQFWDYSFHEMGVYDLPALIDKVLAETNQTQLFYIGHSMGTSVFYVMCSVKPEYNEKVKMAVHLAPIAFNLKKQMTFSLRVLLQNVYRIADILKKQNLYEFLPRNRQNYLLVDFVCSNNYKHLCQVLVSQLYGPSCDPIKTAKMRTYLKRLISGTSVKTMLHLSHIYNNRTFAMFDYGSTSLNNQFYSQDHPPPYPLERVTAPVALFYGDSDAFVDEFSISQLKNRLPNVVTSVALPKYNHIDPLFAESSPKLLYKKIVKLFDKS